MTLGGLLKHLSYVEEYWFSRAVARSRPRASVERRRLGRGPRLGMALGRRRHRRSNSGRCGSDTVDRSRALVDEAASDGDGLGRLAERKWPDGRSPSLRWILVHMIEEYSRHNGHADLLRESVDGRTGE